MDARQLLNAVTSSVFVMVIIAPIQPGFGSVGASHPTGVDNRPVFSRMIHEAGSSPDAVIDLQKNQTSNAMMEFVSGMPGYGGIWLDESGMIHIASTADAMAQITDVLGSQFHGEYVIDAVEYSYTELIQRRDSISINYESLKDQGINLHEWGPDARNNTIWVSILDFSEESKALAHQKLGTDIIVRAASTNNDGGDLFVIR